MQRDLFLSQNMSPGQQKEQLLLPSNRSQHSRWLMCITSQYNSYFYLTGFTLNICTKCKFCTLIVSNSNPNAFFSNTNIGNHEDYAICTGSHLLGIWEFLIAFKYSACIRFFLINFNTRFVSVKWTHFALWRRVRK